MEKSLTESWSIAHAQLCCNVRWDGANLLWQLEHPKARGGATQLDVVLEDETDRLRLTHSFQLLDAHPFARTWSNVENAGTVQASRGFFVGRG